MSINKKMDAERLFRLRIVMILLPTILGILIWTNIEVVSDLFQLNYRIITAIAGYLIAIGTGYFLMIYLKGGIRVPVIEKLVDSAKPLDKEYEIASEVSIEIQELKKKISEISYAQLQLGEGQQEAILQELKETISEDLAVELEKEYSGPALAKAHLKQAKENFRKSIERLSKEIETLTRRANLNLVIGVLTTSIAVSLLTYMVLGTDAKLDSLTGILSYYVPRVTVVIFIEIFSFFFLRMYKSNLSEIKFYQQEITKISTQQVIYESTVLLGNSGSLKDFVQYSLNQNLDANETGQTKDVSAQISTLSKVVQDTSKIISSISKSSTK